MKFTENPYYSPELCGLEIFESIDTADSYEYDLFVIWKKLDDDTLWWDTDSGCSCPSPFDNGDHGHDLKLINADTLHNFYEELKSHCDITQKDINNIYKKVTDYINKT